MKIPVYRPQTAYARAYARDVALARPLPEASGQKKYTNWQSLSGAMHGIYEFPSFINRTGDAYEFSKDKWKDAWGELIMRVKKGNRKAYLSKYPHRRRPEDGPAEQAQRAQESAGESGAAFSSSLREEQLRFAREKADVPHSGENAQAADPVKKLDENFVRTAQEALADGGAGADLLSQDYVLLRREMERAQKENAAFLAKENFSRGAGTFVQTAALAHTPRALEAYIESNLSAAEAEARAAGWDKARWGETARILRTQALRHNVEAALQAGQSERAEDVLRHFAEKLPPQERDLLEHKLTAGKADTLGEKLWPLARKECTDEKGRPLMREVRRFAQQAAPKESDTFRRELADSLGAHINRQYKRDLRRRARAYERLADAREEADLSSLMNGDCFGAQEFENNLRALRKWQTEEGKTSSVDVFNRLYEAAYNGLAAEEETEKAVDTGKITARDYWLIKSRAASAQAGENTLKEKILGASVRRLCRLNALSPQETDEVLYFVFTSGRDVRERSAAARAVKETFLLQENKR